MKEELPDKTAINGDSAGQEVRIVCVEDECCMASASVSTITPENGRV